MFKVIVILVIYISASFADTFHFKELRYSNAIDKAIEIEGQIRFMKNGLKIFYPQGLKSIKYQNDIIVYKEDNQETELGIGQQRQLASYFDILILLHQGNESAYKDMFEVSKRDLIVTLEPTGMLEDYIKKIETFREKEMLKEVKIFLQNDDYIVITIYDEI
ncbi:hypothetical protein N9X61_03590 [Sulfurimonas sp.]|nr:hypothetical protein [Sulfurimonas sp.]